MKTVSSKKGFTLIELLVVIGIIGSLSGVVVASVGVAREKAENTKIVANAELFLHGLNSYYAEHGEYPNPQPDLEDSTLYCLGYLNDHAECNSEYDAGFQQYLEDSLSPYITPLGGNPSMNTKPITFTIPFLGSIVQYEGTVLYRVFQCSFDLECYLVTLVYVENSDTCTKGRKMIYTTTDGDYSMCEIFLEVRDPQNIWYDY